MPCKSIFQSEFLDLCNFDIKIDTAQILEIRFVQNFACRPSINILFQIVKGI